MEMQLPKQKIRVAIVDDHSTFRDAVRTILSSQPDIECVAELESGYSVIPMLYEKRPDVLLLDLIMPGVDGICTLKRIREWEHNVRTLVLTESDDEGMQALAITLGASGYVVKNKEVEFLVDGIRKVHEGEIWIDRGKLGVLMREMSTEPEATPALSERERDVIWLLCQGLTNAEIADCLYVSENTVKSRLSQIFKKGRRLEPPATGSVCNKI